MTYNKKYTFSFTGASALITETLVIAEAYKKTGNWQLTQQALFTSNALNKIKQTTFNREFSEIKKRLMQLTPPQLDVLIEGSLDDVKAIILLSLVKTYPFFRDFIVEVLRNKYLLFDTSVTESDYNLFFNAKCLAHPELNDITDITAKKVKQVVFKLLVQVGLITEIKNGMLLKPLLSAEVLSVITAQDAPYLAAFLYSNYEISNKT